MYIQKTRLALVFVRFSDTGKDLDRKSDVSLRKRPANTKMKSEIMASEFISALWEIGLVCV
jgi:hypothetical protein